MTMTEEITTAMAEKRAFAVGDWVRNRDDILRAYVLDVRDDAAYLMARVAGRWQLRKTTADTLEHIEPEVCATFGQPNAEHFTEALMAKHEAISAGDTVSNARVEQLERELAEARASLRLEEQRHQTFRDTVREVAIREAEARDWCEEFDQILEELGLEPRTRDYEVAVEIVARQTVYITVSARNEDDAQERVGEYSTYDIKQHVDNYEWEFDGEDWEVGEASEA